jgi:RHS repeat-associated protein
VWQWAYSAFGDNKPTGILKATTNPNSAITNQPVLLQATGVGTTLNLRFPGQYADSETGLFYNTFRSYCPSCGRYTQADQMGLEAGWNQFIYVNANPLSFMDPFGLEGVDVTGDWSNFDPTGNHSVAMENLANLQQQAVMSAAAAAALGGGGAMICRVPAYKLGLAMLMTVNIASKGMPKVPKLPSPHPQTMNQTMKKLKEIQDASRNAQPQPSRTGM